MIVVKEIPGTGIWRQAKRAMTADALADIAKKKAKTWATINGVTSVASASGAVTNAVSGNVFNASLGGLASVLFGTSSGLWIKEFIQASKLKKEATKAIKDIVNKKEFMDIVNRFARMKGKPELTSEQVLDIYNKAAKATK